MLLEKGASGEALCPIPDGLPTSEAELLLDVCSPFCVEFVGESGGTYLRMVAESPEEMRAFLERMTEFPQCWPIRIISVRVTFIAEISGVVQEPLGVPSSRIAAEFLSPENPVAVYFL